MLTCGASRRSERYTVRIFPARRVKRDSSVRLRPVRAHFGGHHALRAGSKAHQHGLARPKLGDAVAAQRLHVDENVPRGVAAGDEAEAAQPVEPDRKSTRLNSSHTD